MKTSFIHFFFSNAVRAGVGLLSIHAACANGSTNVMPSATDMSRLAQSDGAGSTSYCSDRHIEIEKFLCATNRFQDGNAKAKEEAKSVLSSIPVPVASDNMRDIITATVDKGFRFHEADILPVWTGEEWVDGMPLVLNGFSVSKEIRDRLLSINCQERSFGVYFWPESKRKELSKFSGYHPPNRFFLSRIALENMGYELKFDKTFYIWRVTGTNTPAVKTP